MTKVGRVIADGGDVIAENEVLSLPEYERRLIDISKTDNAAIRRVIARMERVGIRSVMGVKVTVEFATKDSTAPEPPKED